MYRLIESAQLYPELRDGTMLLLCSVLLFIQSLDSMYGCSQLGVTCVKRVCST